MSRSQPIRWHGGKGPLASWIIGHMGPHERYVEPYAGGLSVLLRKSGEGVAEFANDAYGELVNFWRVLADEGLFRRFARVVEATPMSGELWSRSRGLLGEGCGSGTGNCQPSSVSRAAAFFVAARQSRQGLMRDYATPTRRLRRGMNEQVSAWLSAVDGLGEVRARLRRVEVWNTEATACIDRLDGPGTLFYCDPPYLHQTRRVREAYEHEMSEADHRRLLDTLAGIEGRFVLSGYWSGLYDGYARAHDWRMVSRRVDNKASGAKHKPRRTECLWTNQTDAGPAGVEADEAGRGTRQGGGRNAGARNGGGVGAAAEEGRGVRAATADEAAFDLLIESYVCGRRARRLAELGQCPRELAEQIVANLAAVDVALER